MKISVRVLVGTLAAVWVSGCSDPLRPADVVGTYILATMEGSPLPRIILDVPGCQVLAIGGELLLNSDATFELTVGEDYASCPAPQPPEEEVELMVGEYRVKYESAELWVGEYRVKDDQVILTAHSSETSDYPAVFRGERLVVDMGGRVGVLGFDRAH
jgi:hypothetical protein